MRTLITAIFALILSLCASAEGDGFPIANFSVTANAGTDGSLFGTTMVNPGKLGDWLSPQGEFPLEITANGRPLRAVSVGREFPFVSNTYKSEGDNPVTLSLTAFAPLELDNIEVSSLPVILTKIDIAGVAPSAPLSLRIRRQGNNALPMAFATDAVEAVVTDSTLSITVSEPGTLNIALAILDPLTLAAKNYSSAKGLAADALRRFDKLLESTRLFSAAIPATGDPELDTYLRWYMIPAIALTKCTAAGEVVTMGYCELNQRDSYWTSWVHLPLFPTAERIMIQESVDAITPSGKIPTTILPLIDRKDDLDINAFFILRVARYLQNHPKEALPESWWEALKAAADWLISRDTDGDGIPVQVSFWGDWKDVKGIEGRKYSPFTALLYLASMRAMADMAIRQGDSAPASKYKETAEKADRFINTPVEEGGLWNGNYYVQRWTDGSVNDHLLQDQTIGILFDVVAPDRANRIFDSLNSRSLTPYGICETSPYYSAEFGYEPATYHNGAVWPWVSFMDAWARMRSGRADEAITLIKKVAKADLVDSGDWSPNEHINSLTGENLGFQLQGWNSDLFGLIYYALPRQNK